MSGHSKWHSIKHKKGAADAKRGKVFTKLAADVALAAREGDDPDMNPRLKLAISKAKDSNMPNANIDRAILRGSGKGENGPLNELTYEGYGPNGVAILVKAISDNKNRTAAEVRSAFSKGGGNLGASGSVAYLFKSVLMIALDNKDSEVAMLAAMDAGVDDIVEEDEELIATANPEDEQKILDELSEYVVDSEVKLIADIEMELDEKDNEKLNNLIEKLESVEDVTEVVTNAIEK